MEQHIEFDAAEAAIAVALSAAELPTERVPLVEDEPKPPTLEQVLAARRPVEARTRQGYRYIVGPHEGPNHQMRRRARLWQERQWRRYMSWRAQLERAGIDPDAVIAKRQVRMEARAEEAARAQRGPETSGDRFSGGDVAGTHQVPEPQRQDQG
jgi:hypothetical protein